MASEGPSFSQLGLSSPVLDALSEIGYQSPSPIQAAAIPALLEGRDVLGQAQTGTGKTAAFALPLLDRLSPRVAKPQILVLTPTRELAMQVAEAFQTYASRLPKIRVAAIYGGQNIEPQVRQLKRGVHVVVGTPGRVMDHMRRSTLALDELSALVLDEADEMLNMGFLEDVQWIVEHAPEERQTALFSATMPTAIRTIARRALRDPHEVKVAAKTVTLEAVRQEYWQVDGIHKTNALVRLLDASDFDAAVVFVRTKSATLGLAEKLAARGHACSALNGDMTQQLRERTVEQLRDGRLDVLVATDVAARGLDVPRITHVFNYDVPHDAEQYVHRIGRTGRAGREGHAILFVTPRERGMLRAIERMTRQKIERIALPTAASIADRRIEQFKQRVVDTIEREDLDFFRDLVDAMRTEHGVSTGEAAAALAFLAQRDRPIQPPRRGNDRGRGDKRIAISIERRSAVRARDAVEPSPAGKAPPTRAPKASPASPPKAGKPRPESPVSTSKGAPDRPQRDKPHRDKPQSEHVHRDKPHRGAPARGPRPAPPGMVRYRVAVGSEHGVKRRDIVGAIANETGIDREFIGQVRIETESSTVDLPDGMPKEIFRHLQRVRIRHLSLDIRREGTGKARGSRAEPARERGGYRGAHKGAHKPEGGPKGANRGAHRGRTGKPRGSKPGATSRRRG